METRKNIETLTVILKLDGDSLVFLDTGENKERKFELAFVKNVLNTIVLLKSSIKNTKYLNYNLFSDYVKINFLIDNDNEKIYINFDKY